MRIQHLCLAATMLVLGTLLLSCEPPRPGSRPPKPADAQPLVQDPAPRPTLVKSPLQPLPPGAYERPQLDLSRLPPMKLTACGRELEELARRRRGPARTGAAPPPAAAAPSPAPPTESRAKAEASARRSELKKTAVSKGVLELLGSQGGGGAVADILGEGAPSGDLDTALEGATGLAVARDEEAPSKPVAPPRPDPDEVGWGEAIYLSNDDSMSLSSAQRIEYAIDRFRPLPLQHIRPHELLNYYTFPTAPVRPGSTFSVQPSLLPEEARAGFYTLGLAVKGRPVTRTERRNLVLTVVVDKSGSMGAEGRMEYLKRGLKQMLPQLERGDTVSLVQFDNRVCTPVEGYVHGRDPERDLVAAIDALRPGGSTDLHGGLTTGYQIAERLSNGGPPRNNRVLLITDARTNTGVTDERLISAVSRYYDSAKIRLSGVGVGSDFNDRLLDRLTERGKGAYVFLGSDAVVDRVFSQGFISLVETVALDVHFRLKLPPSLRMKVFYGEEASTVKADVQAIHYFAGTSQLFLADLEAREHRLPAADRLGLDLEWTDPETGARRTEDLAWTVGQIVDETSAMVRKARYVMAYVDALAEAARLEQRDRQAAAAVCTREEPALARTAADLPGDLEVPRVLERFRKYCARFEKQRVNAYRR